MRRRGLGIAVIVALALVAVAVWAIIGARAITGRQPVFTIIHTNDMHGYLEPERIAVGSRSFASGGMASIVGAIEQWRAANPKRTLVLDAGDIWQGTYISNQSEGQVMIEIMNMAGYAATAPGNHDFDFGQGVLTARIAQARFPFLAANIVEESSGQIPSWLKPYLIVTLDDLRIGIIGLGYPGTPFISKPQNVQGLAFLPAAESVAAYLGAVRQQADMIVVLSHLGLADDEKLAADVAGIDLIVGGHSHVVQTNPKQVGKTLIVQAGGNTKNIGKLDVTFDRAKQQITSYTLTNEVVAVVSNTMKPNAAVDNLVKAKAAEAEVTLKKPLGEALIAMENCYSGECPLGNLIADAMLAANQAGPRPADVSMHNNAGLRAPLAKGSITYGALFQVLPFGNVLAALDLTGQQIWDIMEKTVAGRPGNMVVAGMTYTFDQSRPIGSRILSITIGGQPIDRKKVYRVQTIDYLASGGDGQETFKDGANVVYGDPCIDVVADYIKKHSPINPKVEGRIVGK
jgi:2',3'-cyclic-nucleotide 2'-phosphodiesterase (5'-nucleotidase family)